MTCCPPVFLLTTVLTLNGMYYHLRNSSGTGWCVAGTSDGLFTCSWDRINPGRPAQDAVYGAPYTGCGYNFQGGYNGRRSFYPIGSTVRTDVSASTPSLGNCSTWRTGSFNRFGYAGGCRQDGGNAACPIAGYHLEPGRDGRPYATLISPSVPATPETYPYTGAPHYHLRLHITTTTPLG